MKKFKKNIIVFSSAFGILVPTSFIAVSRISENSNTKIANNNSSWYTGPGSLNIAPYNYNGSWIYNGATNRGTFVQNFDFWNQNEEVYQDRKIVVNYIGDASGAKTNPVFNINVKGLSSYADEYGLKLTKSQYNFSSAEKSQKAMMLQNLADFILKKFRQDIATEIIVPASEYYIPVDTYGNGGAITLDTHVRFRSSWGTYNNDRVPQNFYFNIDNKYVTDQSTGENGLERGLVIDSITPETLGLLPLMHIFSPPIELATFQSEYISSYSTNTNYREEISLYGYSKQHVNTLIMPEGADKGLSWWEGLIDGLAIGSILFGGIGLIPSLLEGVALGISVGALAAGVTGIGLNQIGYSTGSLNERQQAIKDLRQKVIDAGDNVSIKKRTLFLDNNEKHRIEVNGNIFAKANATGLFGNITEFNLDRIIGFMNAELRYTSYVNLM